MVAWGSLPRNNKPDHGLLATPEKKEQQGGFSFGDASQQEEKWRETMSGHGRVVLNVGGKIFVTLSSTLMDSPYFEKLLANRMGDEGDIFIDRDGEPFSYILSFLRTGSLVIAPEAQHMLKSILLEAEYYGVAALDGAYEKFEYTYLVAPKSSEGVTGLVRHRCFPECFFRSIRETKIVSLSPAVPDTYVHWIDGDDVEHGMPIVAMALVELIYGDSRVEPMIKFENDYVQPISTIPNQNAAHTWWIVKKTLVKMDESMVKSALSARRRTSCWTRCRPSSRSASTRTRRRS
ncbi:hypothetical protein JL721_4135 [Aureococcus anophagefferens]|nr:hypothetical protein JL721_4135 [Aureococcus anophagefferens]